MRTHMSLLARRELALRMAGRPYKNAARPEKKRILDKFLASTGFHRKHATRLLNEILRGEVPRRACRGRSCRYGPAVQVALILAWRTVNYICGRVVNGNSIATAHSNTARRSWRSRRGSSPSRARW